MVSLQREVNARGDRARAEPYGLAGAIVRRLSFFSILLSRFSLTLCARVKISESRWSSAQGV